MKPPYADRYSWMISGWQATREREGRSFSIWVSPRFFEAAEKMDYDQSAATDHINRLAAQAGIGIDRVEFNRWGLKQVYIGDNGVEFYLERHPDDVYLTQGAEYVTHNLDRSADQSFLMAVWVWWASCVEMEIGADEE